MLFTRVNRSDPEKVFIIAYNSWSTAALTSGQAVSWDYTTDCNGVGVTQPLAGPGADGGLAGAGIVAETIGIGSYGLIQVYGYHPAAYVNAAGVYSELNIAVGNPLVIAPRVAGFHMNTYDCTAANVKLAFPCAFALQLYSSSVTVGTIPVFIKAL